MGETWQLSLLLFVRYLAAAGHLRWGTSREFPLRSRHKCLYNIRYFTLADNLEICEYNIVH